MRIAAITGQGLRWISALVLVLWVCVVAENSMVKHARRETVTVLAELQRLRGQRPVPVSQPGIRLSNGTKAAIG